MLELTSRDGKRTEQVADYVLTEEVLGTGSFGQVVLARHRKSKELVAIKVLTRDNDENTVRRISGEVSTMEKVGAGCPFIVQLYEVLVGHNHIYLVVEFAAGGELFKAMFKPETLVQGHVQAGESSSVCDIGSPKREKRARKYFQQLVIGLYWCHKHGVAHRDLKPQNLLLSLDGMLKIADFGLAASFNPDPAVHVSTRVMRQTMCGSPLYMAPEMLQLRHGATYNAILTDTWGCGACLYAMLLGRPPFPAASFNELVSLASRPNVNLHLPAHLPKDLVVLMRAMLRLDPRQRHSLQQVAQSPWFQEDFAEMLARTPSFVPPEGLRPITHTAAPEGSQAPRKPSVEPAQVRVEKMAYGPAWSRGLSSMLGRRRARVRPSIVHALSMDIRQKAMHFVGK